MYAYRPNTRKIYPMDEWGNGIQFLNLIPERQQVFDEFHYFLISQSFAVNITKTLLPDFEKYGLDNVSKTDFYSLGTKQESATQVAHAWELSSFPPIFPMIYAKTDEGEKRSTGVLIKMVEEKTKRLIDFQAGGGFQVLPW